MDSILLNYLIAETMAPQVRQCQKYTTQHTLDAPPG